MEYPIRDTINNIYNADEASLNFIEEWQNDNDYIVALTSGSTGTPKPIKLLKNDMRTSALATCKFFNITNSSTLVSPLSSNYIAGKMMIVRAIVSGAKLYIEKPSNQPLNKDYGKIDLLPVTPSQVEWLITKSKYTDTINNLLIGGGSLSFEYEQGLINKNINAFVSYGMTETCSHIAIRKIGQKTYKTIPSITISTDNRGCLIINSPKFSFKKITTNDIVEFIDTTHFKWIGRYDNIINSGGIKINPEIIEQKLSPIIPYPFYIIGEKDIKWGEIITLYIETTTIDIDDILRQAKIVLERYYIPKKIKCVANFKRTESGKIKRMCL